MSDLYFHCHVCRWAGEYGGNAGVDCPECGCELFSGGRAGCVLDAYEAANPLRRKTREAA